MKAKLFLKMVSNRWCLRMCSHDLSNLSRFTTNQENDLCA